MRLVNQGPKLLAEATALAAPLPPEILRDLPII